MEEKEVDKIELRSEEFQEVLGKVPNWILRRGITVILAILIIILIGSAIFKYPDTISTTITLTGTTPPARVVAKSSGKVQELLVDNNQQVQSADYLLVIENPATTRDVIYLKKYLKNVSLKMDTMISLPPENLELGALQANYSSFYLALFEYEEFKRLRYYNKKIDFMKDRIGKNEVYYSNTLKQKRILESQMELIMKQYSRDSLLNIKGIIPAEDLEKTHSQYLQGLLSLESMNSSLENMQIQITQMKESLLDAEYQYTEKNSSLRTSLSNQLTQLQSDIQAWEMNYVLVAPIDGKMSFSNYWSENQNITAGEEILSIIPEDKGKLLGKVQLPITRSGKVKPGQKVNIRFDNFPDNEFGMVRGVVQNISLVPYKAGEENNYSVDIGLPEGLVTSYKRELPYLPEMTGQADIVTDDISVLERFFMP